VESTPCVPQLVIPPRLAKTVLDNGTCIVTETMEHVRSVAVGIWLDCGSRHESPDEGGISHFTEHMVFKGSENRSAEEIAFAIDGIGGHLDAFTTKESVAFTAKVLDEHVPTAIDVIGDMVLHPVFDASELEKEKGVVLEELKMDEDSPDYLIQDIFSSSFWSGQALGRPIIGTKSLIERFNRVGLQQFHQRAFRPDRILVTAAGNLRHEAFVEQVERQFGKLAGRSQIPMGEQPRATPSIVLHDKPSLEQAHICIGVPAHAMAAPERFVGYILSTILGGGVSSRLFLKIREQAGLAYAVYSDQSLYADAGCMTVYAGTSVEATPEVVALVMAEFGDLKRNAVSPEELRRAKDHLKGSLTLSLESTSSRMSNLARQEKYFRRWISLEEVHEGIEAVTAEEVQTLANNWFQQDSIALTVLGGLNGLRIERDDLSC
jgi:predicted Zn-dependent peptidase